MLTPTSGRQINITRFVVVLYLLGALMIGALIAGGSSMLALAAMGGLLVANLSFVLLFSKTLQFYALLVLLLVNVAFFDWVGYQPVIREPINLFASDGIFFLFIIAFTYTIIKQKQFGRLFTGLLMILVANLIYGIFMVVIGIMVGNSLNNVIGDFRRFFIYPLVTLFPLTNIIGERDWKKLLVTFTAGLLIVAAIAMGRMVTGDSWSPEQFVTAGDFRAVGYFTGILLIMGVALFYSLSQVTKGIYRWIASLLMGLFVLVSLFSGYRLLWGLALVVPVMIAVFGFRKRGQFVRLAVTLFVIVCVLVAAIYLLQTFTPEIYSIYIQKFVDRVLGFNFLENTRYFAWTTAWEKFLSSPLIGVGIGDAFEYFGLSSAGRLVVKSNTTHNILLSILYQAGIIGAGLFVWLHFWIIRNAWVRIRYLPGDKKGIVVSMLVAYLGALSMGMLQPMLETPGAIVLLYLWIGFTLKYTHLSIHRLSVMRS